MCNDLCFLTLAYLFYLTDKLESGPVPPEDKDASEHESTKTAESEVIEMFKNPPKSPIQTFLPFFDQQLCLSSQTSKESESYPDKTSESEELKRGGAEQKSNEESEKKDDSSAESEPLTNQTQPISKQNEQSTNQTAPAGENKK